MQGSKEEKKEKYTCKFFLQGTCKNGVNCKFIHPVNANQNHKVHNNDKNFDDKKHNYMKQNSINVKELEMSLQKGQSKQEHKKHPRDQYFEKMIDSMKIVCLSCSKKELPIYLSCGCSSICEDCVKQTRPCGGKNHIYDPKIYIK